MRSPPPVERDLLDAIQHADYGGDAGWQLSDFDVRYLGELALSELRRFDDVHAWLDVDPNDFAGLSVEDRLKALESFRGAKWVERAREWLKSGVPPIVVIDAPSESEALDVPMLTQIGDGRGRVNFAYALGVKKVPVYRMTYRRPYENPLDARRARLVRLFNSLMDSAPDGAFPQSVALVIDEETALQGRPAHGRACAASSEDTVHIAPKLLDASYERQAGVLMHELAHVHLLQYGNHKHTERRADEVAEALWATRINYDDEDVQTIGPGTHPRPARLDKRSRR